MAANQFQPAKLLGIGHINIHERFDCVGHTQGGTKCSNRLNKNDKTDGRDILRRISTMDAYYDDFNEILWELGNALLCTKSKYRRDLIKDYVEDWAAKIKEYGDKDFERRGGDTIMGEASDAGNVQFLRDEIADLTVRIGRSTINDEAQGSSSKGNPRHLNN